MVMHVYSMSVTANLTHLDNSQAENATWHEQLEQMEDHPLCCTSHSGQNAPSPRWPMHSTEARPHLQGQRTSLKGDPIRNSQNPVPLGTKP